MRQEYLEQQAFFQFQPEPVKRFMVSQARSIAQAFVQDAWKIKFTLPDQVMVSDPVSGQAQLQAIPARRRGQVAGGLSARTTRSGMEQALRQRFLQLILSPVQAVSVSAALLRHATVLHILCHLLPSGIPVTYICAAGEEIPTIPVDGRFYFPEWVAFDAEGGNLLVNSVTEAEASLASLQRFLKILDSAATLAPYFEFDEIYQQKRYGILGQLVNQGRALAKFQTNEIIAKIKRRAQANNLNRGLSLSLPYFDDRDLVMRLWDFVVIPASRMGFYQAFIPLAALDEQANVAQDHRLSPSTRHYLLVQLRMLERAFRE
jgi:hypothetical protein